MEEQTAPVAFSEWLKRRRKALDMTQDELAQRAGCSVSALRKIETGERRPSKQLASLFAKALDVTSDEHQTFVRAARGELNIERLRQPVTEPLVPIPEAWAAPKAPQASQSQPSSIPASPANRIPSQTTPLIGREYELAAMERLFNEPQCRLLTLTGIGGVGKTRLAVEFAARNVLTFPGGVFYIPLAPVSSPEKIVTAVADVLDYVFSGPSNPKEQLFNYIFQSIRQDALFVFDNLEHLLGLVSPQYNQTGLVELVAEILQRFPSIKILGTSRERLNLQGEWAYELHGLSVPPAGYDGAGEEYQSLSLFINSAQRIRTDFLPGGEELHAVTRICQIVEGVPLAIELAAAWVGMLSCQKIAQEIQANMDFLTSSMRDIPERHRSIRATFDHSWKLLSDEERWVLCQLSVFQGGFNRHAASWVAGASLPLLASLSAKSLVRRSQSGRYDLHEVIRQYALSHLNQHPGVLGTRERHCDHYLDQLCQHEKLLKSELQQEAVRQLADDIDNIRAAWGWAVQHQKFSQMGQAGRAFGWFFEILGLYREGIEQLELFEQALKGPEDHKWQRVLGLIYTHKGLLYLRIGEFDQAVRYYEESILMLRPANDPALLADALIFLGVILYLTGDYKSAREHVEEGLIFSRTAVDSWLEAFAAFNLGYMDSLMGRYTKGYEQMQSGLAIWRSIGDPHAVSLGLNFQVPTMINLGLSEEAEAMMRESIQLCEQSKNRWGMGTAYRFLGLAMMAGGKYAEAKAQLQKSLEVFGEYFVGWDIARSLTYLGDAARLSGGLEEARKIYQKALKISIEAKALPIILDSLAGICCLHAQNGETVQALIFCQFILNHPSLAHETRYSVEKMRLELESKLSEQEITTAHESASREAFEGIVTQALNFSF